MDFLPLNLRSLVYVLLAFVGALLLSRFLTKKEFPFQWFALSVIVTSTAFIVPSFLGLVGILIIYHVKVLPPSHQKNKRVIYYFLFLPLIPEFLRFVIPFPGINFLTEISYPQVVTLIVLLPNLLNKGASKLHVRKAAADIPVILFTAVLCMLSFRNPSMTAALRKSFVHIVDIIIPYFAISRSVESSEDFEEIMKVIFYTGFIIACIGILEQIKRWTFYPPLATFLNLDFEIIYGGQEIRSGLLRIKSTMGETIPLGYYLMIPVGALLHLVKSKNIKMIPGLIFFLILGVSVYFTQSRAGMLGFIMLISLYFFFVTKIQAVRFAMVALALIIGTSTLMLSQSVSTESLDEYGTFDYRVALIQQSILVIENNFLFGSSDFMEADELQQLIQGQGIIDIVNTYVSVALYSGMVGLSLFVAVYLLVIGQIYIKINKSVVNLSEKFQSTGVVILVVIITTAIVIGTTSAVGHIPVYSWAFLGLGSAYIRCVLPTEEALSEADSGEGLP